MNGLLLAKIIALVLRLLEFAARYQAGKRAQTKWAQKLQVRLGKIESKVRDGAGPKSDRLRDPDAFQRDDDE